MLISDVRIGGQSDRVDVRCRAGDIAEIGVALRREPGEPVLAGEGGALLPGLHDHHMHLYALAAAESSVACGPPVVSNREQLEQALSCAAGSGWLRGVGYHESVAGPLDRVQLDRMVSDRPLRIQHRSGKLWMVNTRGARLLALDKNPELPGVELDDSGDPNGRLFRLDDWMREQPGAKRGGVPSLAGTSRKLARFGVTGVTDTTPGNGPGAMQAFCRAVMNGELLQNVRVMGGDDLPHATCPQVQRGERKILLDEDALPGWEELCSLIGVAHGQDRAVAVHCVTPAELVLTLSVLREVGTHPGDRVEHASLVPESLLPLLQEVGVRVVTQPGFVHERGDQYLREIDKAEHGYLYRCRQLLAADIPLGGSTDAPYGDPDPWRAMRAAVYRTTGEGQALGAAERLTPEQALALFTCPADYPGGASRRVAVGEPADLCLLDRPWREARSRLSSADVRATLRAGTMIYRQPSKQGGHHAVVAA